MLQPLKYQKDPEKLQILNVLLIVKLPNTA